MNTNCVKRHWLITDKGDPAALALVDGVSVGKAPHYSRQQPGTRSFTRNGQNLVFITADALACWVTFRPTPGKAVRPDGRDVWECALFRNEGPHLSSALIREAVALTCALWGTPPPGGIVTFVRPDKVDSGLPGYCYRRAGWRRKGASKDGKPMFRAPRIGVVPDWREWAWSGDRGGKLRRALEQPLLLEAHP
ncbi:hypothetical protein [Myxococcus virescens]|uniref:Uncharacterized protein n=1 Tax=Myxococcus virescens TaxID=83456 RepID=A0A511HNM7_9BACT|nr:hypothetical protein [Myxococcus virescens]GEL75181.1 hypothetical protein MVI01_69650 [Myxococcus virescens]SDD64640.1 hypothetical protein SAMN04488504_102106 [Myxococcus virescens]